MSDTQEKLPEWMLKLENKRKKQHRLAHEIGAGAPCFVCGDNCPGLDLHFWRKLCRNCKCKKEDHDVKDDEGYEQFEILLGGGGRKKRKGGFLKIKVPEDVQSPVGIKDGSSKEVSFDWLPPNVSEDVAAEYMRQLPVGKLPISGSDGALYRRQQLTKQVPLHDLDARHCHNLTPEEIEQLLKYLENLKSNVVGQGCVGKVPNSIFSGPAGSIKSFPGAESLFLDQVTGRPLITSKSADPIRTLPPMPPAYNSMPRPFHASSPSSAYGSGEDEELPPPLPSSLPPRTDLKTPSGFIPDWRLPSGHVFGKVVEGIQDIQLKQDEIPSSHVKDTVTKGITTSRDYDKQQPQFSNNLSQSPVAASGDSHTKQVSKTGFSQALNQDLPPGAVLGIEGLQKASGWHSAGPGSELALPVSGIQNAAHHAKGILDPKEETISGSRLPTSTAMNIGIDRDDTTASLPADSTEVFSLFPKGMVHSSAVNQHGRPMTSKPLPVWKTADSNIISLDPANGNTAASLPTESTQVSSVFPKGIVNSSTVGQHGRPMTSKPLADRKTAGSNVTSPNPDNDRGVGVLKANDSLSSLLPTSALAQSETISGVRGVAEPLQGRKGARVSFGKDGQYTDEAGNSANTHPDSYLKKQLLTQPTQLNYGTLGLNQGILSSSLPAEGIRTSSVVPHAIVQSSSVDTDALPKSAQMMQQHHAALDPGSIAAFPGSAAPLPAETPGGGAPHLDCRECSLKLLAGDVAVFAERAGNAAWHPSCFVCFTCKELLVDLMYFYHKSNVYCGRHFAELLGIPRCFACDELIFVKEYTQAEGKVFHVKHFCCYECDDPLANKQYIPVDDQPVCLECYERKYGKKCHTCKCKIAPGEQRVGWKHFNWHVQGNCFRCFECSKLLLGGRFVFTEDQPFCSKECVQAGLQKMAGAA